ncbi:MAG: T9SS type A sorting domain-containing protein, partial [Chlorobi bacterium]|nr:T9SS type A sorting domain-containing protein [Chlorobiota bacterium]
PGNKFAMIGDHGTLNLRNNFIKPDWVISHGSTDGTVNVENNIEQEEPGFVNFDGADFHLTEESPCVNAGAYLDAKIMEEFSPEYHYIHERLREPRKDIGMPDIGAYAYDIPAGIKDISSSDNINIYPQPVQNELTIKTKSVDKIEILNINGKIIKTISTNSADEIRIDCRAMNLIPGVYFLRIYDFSGNMKNGKFVFVGE